METEREKYGYVYVYELEDTGTSKNSEKTEAQINVPEAKGHEYEPTYSSFRQGT